MTSLSISPAGRRPRAIGILAAAAVVVVGSYVVAGLGPAAGPIEDAVPRAPSGVTEPARIEGGGAPVGSLAQIDHSIEAWSKNLEANPRDYLAATNLAVLDHGRGRLRHDLTDHQRALAAADMALEIEPNHAPARAIRAAILFTLHDFKEAFAAADALVRDDPSQLGALATRFDAEIELGRIQDARVDLDRLSDAGGPAVLVRQARLESASGAFSEALVTAQRALSLAIDDEVEDIGFYAYAVGEYARLAGDVDAARAAYRQALDIRSGDIGALVGLARIEADDGKVDAAIDGLKRATAIAPLPEALALLGDLQASVGDAGSSKTYDTVRFIERLGDIQSATFDRELLRFELDHGGASAGVLARARSSLEARPDWTGHDTLAWALYRTGSFDEAASEIAAARALGADGARLRFHQGAIAIARGEVVAGRALLRSALDLGPALDPIERQEATTLLGG